MLKKEKTLKKHIEMWDWMAETGSWSKSDYFRHKNMTRNIPDSYNYCCEYTLDELGGCDCEKCLLYANVNSKNNACCAENSPYMKWIFSSSESERKKHAKEFADLARDALSKL